MRRKTDEAKRLELQQVRNYTALRLDILCRGVASSLSGKRTDVDSIKSAIAIMTDEVLPAAIAAEAAYEAYAPYWRRRSYVARKRRSYVARKKK